MVPIDESTNEIDISNFTLVVANDRPILLDNAVEEKILCTLSEKDLTQTEVSKLSEIPISTTYNHLQRMCELGLVNTHEIRGKTYYHNNSRILLSTDYSKITPGVGLRLISHLKDGGDVFMYSFLWTMVEFESLGIDPSFITSKFGGVIGNLFNEEDKSKTIEALMKELSKFIVEKGFSHTFNIVTYLPLTIRCEFDVPFFEYPLDQMQHIIINIVKCVVEKFTGEQQYPFNTKIGDTEDGTAYMEFSLSSTYRSEGDPWKVLCVKHT